jgi:hypothetical protein
MRRGAAACPGRGGAGGAGAAARWSRRHSSGAAAAGPNGATPGGVSAGGVRRALHLRARLLPGRRRQPAAASAGFGGEPPWHHDRPTRRAQPEQHPARTVVAAHLRRLARRQRRSHWTIRRSSGTRCCGWRSRASGSRRARRPRRCAHTCSRAASSSSTTSAAGTGRTSRRRCARAAGAAAAAADRQRADLPVVLRAGLPGLTLDVAATTSPSTGASSRTTTRRSGSSPSSTTTTTSASSWSTARPAFPMSTSRTRRTSWRSTTSFYALTALRRGLGERAGAGLTIHNHDGLGGRFGDAGWTGLTAGLSLNCGTTSSSRSG